MKYLDIITDFKLKHEIIAAYLAATDENKIIAVKKASKFTKGLSFRVALDIANKTRLCKQHVAKLYGANSKHLEDNAYIASLVASVPITQESVDNMSNTILEDLDAGMVS